MPTTKQPMKAVLLRQVNAFNRAFPQGTPVIVTDENGLERRTLIRQKAFVLNGVIGTACLVGAPFYCAIDRVRPAEAP
jgi:hypothetical protein